MFALLLAALQVPAATPCALRAPSPLPCSRNATAMVAVPAEWSNDAVERVATAAATFRALFGVEPGRGVLVGTASLDTSTWNDAQAQGHGAWRLAWPLDRVAGSATPEARARALSAMAHEMAHLWFIAAFWPDPAAPGEVRYGSAAPDWLDEIAAALLEDSLTTRRPPARLRDGALTFERFLTMSHPALAQRAWLAEVRTRAAAAGAAGASASAMQLTPPPGLADSLALFYGQVRSLATFLATRARGTAPFGTLARALRGGQSLDAFLRQRGEAMGWPPGVAELEAAFTAWVRSPS